MRGRHGRRAPLVALALAGAVAPALAQELEPRAYAPSPTGVNFVLLGYGHSRGDIVFDAALPFSDVSASLNSTSLAYGHTFGLFGRSASAAGVLPYAWGSIEGNVGEQRRRITRSGLADVRLRLSMNLVGGAALAPKEFAARRLRTALGASLVVVGPSGQYDPAKLINIGANRWAIKPELGLTHPVGRWWLELYGGVWFFSANSDFFGDSRREQQPIGTLQAHASYTFRPRMWLGGDATFYTGGRSRVDGGPEGELLRNSRLGLTLALPAGRHHSLKVAWATGFTTRIGGDFDTLAIGWQVLWFGRP
jgi:hypothetical protein